MSVGMENLIFADTPVITYFLVSLRNCNNMGPSNKDKNKKAVPKPTAATSPPRKAGREVPKKKAKNKIGKNTPTISCYNFTTEFGFEAYTTAASETAAATRPNKRSKNKDDGSLTRDDSSNFRFLSDDVLASILQYVSNDLDEFAECSKRCNQARNHESLPTQRKGTITIRNTGTTVLDFLGNCQAWGDSVFVGNRSHLCIDGLEKLVPSPMAAVRTFLQANKKNKLPGVKSLDISDDSRLIGALSLIFPNLESIDLTHVHAAAQYAIESLCKNCHSLSKVTWKRLQGEGLFIYANGKDFKYQRALRELYIENAIFFEDSFVVHEQRDACVILEQCSQTLERLDIKNAKFGAFGMTSTLMEDCVIVGFVRNTPSLRWLRSNLSSENIAMLKQEHPEVTFVS